MSKKIHVLLLEDIPDVGRTGDIVSVAEGFARNSLFPEGKAALANKYTQSRHAAQQAKLKIIQEQEREKLQAKAEILDNSEITFTARVKEGEEIYGSITKKQVLEELNKKADLSLKINAIKIKAPLKQLGTYELIAELSRDIECKINVVVVPDPASVMQNDGDEE